MRVFTKLFRHAFRVVITSAFLLLSNIAYANIGLEWLESIQNDDGSFSQVNDISTVTQSTAEAVITLLSLKQNTSANIPLAVEYLNSNSDLNTENLSRIIIVNSMIGNSVNEYVSLLTSYQNDDGGYGESIGYASNPLDTAYALQALAVTSFIDYTSISWSLDYLQLTKNKNGGYGVFQINGGESSVFVTSQVIIALQEYQFKFNLSENINVASEYLFSFHNSNGYWDTLLENAYASIALIPNLLDRNRLEYAISRLIENQSPNGDLESDVYITALSLRSINKADSMEFNGASNTGSIIGNVYDGLTTLPINNATINVSSETGYVDSVVGSEFNVKSLEPGVYTINYLSEGYGSEEVNVVIQTGKTTVMNDVYLFPMDNFSIIKGVVRNYDTGSPLSNVNVVVNNEVVITNAEGGYVIAVPSTTLNVSMAKSGFDNVNAEIISKLGETINFSPFMYTEGTTPDSNASVQAYGIIVDAYTGEKIEGAVISVSQDSQYVNSDANGGFTLSDMVPGNVVIKVSKLNYVDSTVSVYLNDKKDQDIGVLEIRNDDNLSITTIQGYIKDSISNEPIIGAKVSMGSNGYSTVSDNNGYYNLSNITNIENDISLIVTADSYYSIYENISLSSQKIVNYDVLLAKSSHGDTQIGDLSTSKYIYKSYENAVINSTINNSSQDEITVRAVFDILDSDNNVLSHYSGNNNDGQDIVLAVGESNNIISNWYTQYTSPGIYRARLRIYELNGRLADEDIVSFEVDKEATLVESNLAVSPGFVVEGNEIAATVSLKLKNKSNVDRDISAIYKLYDPNGELINEINNDLTLLASDVHKSILLDDDIRQYELPGEYPISVTINDDTSTILSGKIVVLPLVRINIQQDISPKSVPPSGDSNVDIIIFIEGAIK